MNAKVDPVTIPAHKPLNLTSKDLAERRFEYYAYLREHLPVHLARIVGMKLYVVSRYEDALFVAKRSDLFCRDRTQIGGKRMPFPVPKNIELLAENMIIADDPQHKRLRSLVQKAFHPKNLALVEPHLVQSAHDLMDLCLAKGEVDLRQAYATPIPSTVIARLMGVDDEDMVEFQHGLRVLSSGLTGLSVVRTMFWDMRRLVKFVRELVARKRENPGEDLLTALIHAEEEGERLSEDELVSMVFLLIVAGYETTLHLITNGALELIRHPEAMQELREKPEIIPSAVEEMLRYCGPIHGTKMNYAREDIELRGVTIPKGMPVFPLLGAANRDPAEFEDPERFDIHRDPNRHLAFSQGMHFCLGAFLARMEAKVAFQVLLERTQSIELAVPERELEPEVMPGWYRHASLPVRLA